jgi:hypothetical protein
MKKTALIMEILKSTNFKFFLHFENDIFFNLEELIEKETKSNYKAFLLGLKQKKFLKHNNDYVYIFDDIDGESVYSFSKEEVIYRISRFKQTILNCLKAEYGEKDKVYLEIKKFFLTLY